MSGVTRPAGVTRQDWNRSRALERHRAHVAAGDCVTCGEHFVFATRCLECAEMHALKQSERRKAAYL